MFCRSLRCLSPIFDRFIHFLSLFLCGWLEGEDAKCKHSQMVCASRVGPKHGVIGLTYTVYRPGRYST